MINNELLRVIALEVLPNQKAEPFSAEAWLYALEMTLLGMGMIFAVLGILWGVLAVFKLVFAKPKKEVKAKAPKVESAPVAEPIKESSAAANDDAELIAILTAAIVAYESEQNPDVEPTNFRVVSYRRANGGRAWNSK